MNLFIFFFIILQSVGETSASMVNNSGIASGHSRVGVVSRDPLGNERSKNSHFVKPDVKQMMPFKPSTLSGEKDCTLTILS